jgi:hypothetical protein
MKRFFRAAVWSACVLMAAGVEITAAAPWIGPEWNYRIAFTARPELIAGACGHPDFTLLLQVDGSNLPFVFEHADQDGSDLVITSGDGMTVLDHEVVTYDAVGEFAEIWFKAPTLSAMSNEFFLYYDSSGSPTPPVPGAAWASANLAVYHFEADPNLGMLADHGPAGNSAVVGPISAWPNGIVAAKIGDGWHFDGLTDHVYAPNISSADSSFTVSAWFANVNLDPGGMVALQVDSGFWDLSFRRTGGSPNAALHTETGSISWYPDLLDAPAHHYLWTVDAVADTARFYLDGVEQAMKGHSWSGQAFVGESIQGRVGIAGPVYFNTLDLTAGVVDEYRIVEGVRGGDWILTEYRNQNNPLGFYTYAAPEGKTVVGIDPVATGPGSGRITVWPNPFQGVAGINIGYDGPAVSVRVYDVAGRLVRDLYSPSLGESALRLRWDGLDNKGTSVGSGIYYIRAVGPNVSVGTKVLLVR